MSEFIRTESSESVLQLRIDRPDKKNALTADMYAAITRALNGAEADPAIRVVTITGGGDCFSSGNDIADFLRQDLTDIEATPVGRFLSVLAGFRKPLLAGVNGVAIGIGVTLLLHCDLVYAADTATFQLPFTNLGVVPEAGSTQLLAQRIGQLRASELMLSGERIGAARALEIGLINQIVPATELATLLATRASTLAAKPAASITATKALLRRQPEALGARIVLENAEFVRLLQLPEARAIMQAFLDRRRSG
jgi:enoyl-CoA hydratase/carnithine racemase